MKPYPTALASNTPAVLLPDAGMPIRMMLFICVLPAFYYSFFGEIVKFRCKGGKICDTLDA